MVQLLTGSSMITSVIMIVGMIAVMYFMMIRPENKRKKEAEEMRSSMKNGDKITTIGGIVGTVVDVKEDKFVIETSADRVRMEFVKWALSTNDSAAERAKEAKKKAAEEKAKLAAAKKAEKKK
ncbi:MAG: preprotein translocase subunit YajC [Oscillospiraceae bacterium]|nr:preprotein translocase subunit YajC [Oscillospiraceae bacterium]